VYFLYYANEEPFTRIVEYKKFYRHGASTTLLGMEIPSFSNKLYPYPMTEDKAIARKYFEALPERVFSIGRSGSYEYRIDIAGCIRQALDLAEKLR
jgi:UDP-galactopyranose mutase